ncbi:LysR substrate-binding domain-containing protein [Sorangium sp. So ce118]
MLASDNRVVDLARREADVALRVVRPREGSLVARRLGTMPYGIFASEAYLERAGRPRGSADLAAHTWVGFEASLAGTPEMRWLLRRVPAEGFAVTTTGTTALVASCAAGLGLALMPLAGARGGELCAPSARLALCGVEGLTRFMWTSDYRHRPQERASASAAAWSAPDRDRGWLVQRDPGCARCGPAASAHASAIRPALCRA